MCVCVSVSFACIYVSAASHCAAPQEAERARQRAAEEEAAKSRARSAAPPVQDELEALIGDLAGSNKKVRVSRVCVCVCLSVRVYMYVHVCLC